MNACFTNCYKYHAALHLYILKILKHWSVMRFSLIILTLFSIAASISAQKSTLMVPAREAYCRIDTAGKSVIPSGRYITPAGQVTVPNNGVVPVGQLEK